MASKADEGGPTLNKVTISLPTTEAEKSLVQGKAVSYDEAGSETYDSTPFKGYYMQRTGFVSKAIGRRLKGLDTEIKRREKAVSKSQSNGPAWPRPSTAPVVTEDDRDDGVKVISGEYVALFEGAGTPLMPVREYPFGTVLQELTPLITPKPIAPMPGDAATYMQKHMVSRFKQERNLGTIRPPSGWKLDPDYTEESPLEILTKPPPITRSLLNPPPHPKFKRQEAKENGICHYEGTLEFREKEEKLAEEKEQYREAAYLARRNELPIKKTEKILDHEKAVMTSLKADRDRNRGKRATLLIKHKIAGDMSMLHSRYQTAPVIRKLNRRPHSVTTYARRKTPVATPSRPASEKAQQPKAEQDGQEAKKPHEVDEEEATEGLEWHAHILNKEKSPRASSIASARSSSPPKSDRSHKSTGSHGSSPSRGAPSSPAVDIGDRDFSKNEEGSERNSESGRSSPLALSQAQSPMKKHIVWRSLSEQKRTRERPPMSADVSWVGAEESTPSLGYPGKARSIPGVRSPDAALYSPSLRDYNEEVEASLSRAKESSPLIRINSHGQLEMEAAFTDKVVNDALPAPRIHRKTIPTGPWNSTMAKKETARVLKMTSRALTPQAHVLIKLFEEEQAKKEEYVPDFIRAAQMPQESETQSPEPDGPKEDTAPIVARTFALKSPRARSPPPRYSSERRAPGNVDESTAILLVDGKSNTIPHNFGQRQLELQQYVRTVRSGSLHLAQVAQTGRFDDLRVSPRTVQARKSSGLHTRVQRYSFLHTPSHEDGRDPGRDPHLSGLSDLDMSALLGEENVENANRTEPDPPSQNDAHDTAVTKTPTAENVVTLPSVMFTRESSRSPRSPDQKNSVAEEGKSRVNSELQDESSFGQGEEGQGQARCLDVVTMPKVSFTAESNQSPRSPDQANGDSGGNRGATSIEDDNREGAAQGSQADGERGLGLEENISAEVSEKWRTKHPPSDGMPREADITQSVMDNAGEIRDQAGLSSLAKHLTSLNPGRIGLRDQPMSSSQEKASRELTSLIIPKYSVPAEGPHQASGADLVYRHTVTPGKVLPPPREERANLVLEAMMRRGGHDIEPPDVGLVMGSTDQYEWDENNGFDAVDIIIAQGTHKYTQAAKLPRPNRSSLVAPLKQRRASRRASSPDKNRTNDPLPKTFPPAQTSPYFETGDPQGFPAPPVLPEHIQAKHAPVPTSPDGRPMASRYDGGPPSPTVVVRGPAKKSMSRGYGAQPRLGSRQVRRRLDVFRRRGDSVTESGADPGSYTTGRPSLLYDDDLSSNDDRSEAKLLDTGPLNEWSGRFSNRSMLVGSP